MMIHIEGEDEMLEDENEDQLKDMQVKAFLDDLK
jgi:hypothetical protein